MTFVEKAAWLVEEGTVDPSRRRIPEAGEAAADASLSMLRKPLNEG